MRPEAGARALKGLVVDLPRPCGPVLEPAKNGEHEMSHG
jgi:hypothetical protein